MRLAALLLVLAFTACGSFSSSASSSLSPSAPAASSPLGLNELKFGLMDTVGKPVYCDPDFYPVARPEGEQASALANYAAIEADAATFAAIVAHEKLPSANLTDSEKLTLYRAWKLLRALSLDPSGTGYSFKYTISAGSAYQLVAGTITPSGRVTVASRTPGGRPNCPICLAAGTLIATPTGEVRVTDVRVGTVVWSEDAAGVRVAEPVIEIGSTSVPPSHLMVDLVLAGGRELLVSPGHPTADGRWAGTLRVGDRLDGSTVTAWRLVPYAAGRTYDILPAGGTGRYWADGIPMGSTLERS